MSRYDPDDIVTYYFVVINDRAGSRIQGWTDNKDLAKFYMEFHSSPLYRLKSLTKTQAEIDKIIEENLHDEIGLATVMIRNRDRKGKKDDIMKQVIIPCTSVEQNFISDEVNTFCGSHVNYTIINDMLPRLKGKWREALQDVFLEDIVMKVIHNRPSYVSTSMKMDHVMILLKLLPDHFGR